MYFLIVYLVMMANNMYNSMHIDDIKNGNPFIFRTRIKEINNNVDLGRVKFIALTLNEKFSGYYEVKSFNLVNSDPTLIEFNLYNYKALSFDVDTKHIEHIALSLTREEFTAYCNDHKNIER